MDSRRETGAKSVHPLYDYNANEDSYSSSTSDGEYNDFANFELRRPRTIVERFLLVLGMSTRRRRRAEDGLDPRSEGLLKKRSLPTREVRRGRKTYVIGWFLRAILVLPLIVLSIFGIIHLLQAFIGDARLFWDLNADDEFLPDFGKADTFGAGLAEYPTDITRDVQPIPCHSHNDYWRRVPLFEAIRWGCTGVEADVWKFDNELYVGHNTASLTRNRTFQNLYINPLVQLLDHMNLPNEFGQSPDEPTGIPRGIFDAAPNQTLILLVDFKTSGRATWPTVLEHLEPLREKDYLTYHDGVELHTRPITVVGTGNTPFDMILNSTSPRSTSLRREIFFDAPIDEMYEAPSSVPAPSTSKSVLPTYKYNASNSLYASVSFTRTIGFPWRGRLSPNQLNLIRGQIRGAHKRGLKVRYWDTPSWPVNLRNHIWSVLVDEGVDMLNADDLPAAAMGNWRRRVHGVWN